MPWEISDSDKAFFAAMQEVIDGLSPKQRRSRIKQLALKWKDGLKLGEMAEYVALFENLSVIDAAKLVADRLIDGSLEARTMQ